MHGPCADGNLFKYIKQDTAMHSNVSTIGKSMVISAVIVLFVFGCGGNLNPLAWKEQIERFASPQQLIQPEKVAAFYEDMEDYVKDNPVEIFSVIEVKVQYANDLVNHGALNHLATAEEVLQTRKDDCDGQAVLLCSILRYAGYEAFVAIGTTHAWVEVEAEKTTLVNYRGGASFVRFNESSVEWNYSVLIASILGEFLVLTVFFSIFLYGLKKGLQEYLQDTLGYLKYVFFLVVIVAVTAVVMSRLWVPGVMVLTVILLFVLEGISRLRSLYERKKHEKTRNHSV